MNRYAIAAWALPIALASPLAAAQSRPDPGDAAAPVPPVRYESPFAGYRPYVEAKPASWKGANENVGRIGGWRTYAREADPQRDPGKTESTPTAPVSAPATGDAPTRGGRPAHKH